MSSPSQITISPARPDDIDEILELVCTALGQGSVPRTAEFWRWKHHSSPFGTFPAWVALAAGRIVGLRTFLALALAALGPADRLGTRGRHRDTSGLAAPRHILEAH